MRRQDIHGRPITGSVFTGRCGECGMPTLDPAEFHPWEACQEFKRSSDSRTIWSDDGRYLLSLAPADEAKP